MTPVRERMRWAGAGAEAGPKVLRRSESFACIEEHKAVPRAFARPLSWSGVLASLPGASQRKEDPMPEQKRYMVDCRELPNAKNCSVSISGREAEVMKVATRHAVEDHGDKDTPELKKAIREHMHEERAARR